MKYFVATTTNNPNHNHEVHKEICRELPSPSNRIYLGDFQFASTALAEAKTHYPDAGGCALCSLEIHHK